MSRPDSHFLCRFARRDASTEAPFDKDAVLAVPDIRSSPKSKTCTEGELTTQAQRLHTLPVT